MVNKVGMVWLDELIHHTKAQFRSYIHVNQKHIVMKNNKDVLLIAIVLLTAIVIACTSCSAGRGMTNCDAARFKMCGYR